MPVKIVRRGDKKDAPLPSNAGGVKIVKKTKPEPAPAATLEDRPVLSKVLHVGNSEIYPDIDVHDESGKEKFLVHFRKPGLWFKVESFDEDTRHVKLRSSQKTSFESKIEGTVPRNYMVVTEKEGAKEPSSAVMAKVYELSGIDTKALKPYLPSKKEDKMESEAPKAARADLVGEPPEVIVAHKKSKKKAKKTVRKSGKVTVKKK